MESPLAIDHFTDTLCVWAWIAQRRVEELESQWGDRIEIRHHCVNVFGDAATRIGEGWADRGGYGGFAEHVEHSAAPYETAPVNPDIWRKVRPFSSATPHLVIKAAEVVSTATDARRLADRLREGFFVDARDVGRMDVALEIAFDAGIDAAALRDAIDSGKALGLLTADYELARQQGVKGSPSWVLNQGRQILYGNVGYRVLNANVEELLKSPADEASWC